MSLLFHFLIQIFFATTKRMNPNPPEHYDVPNQEGFVIGPVVVGIGLGQPNIEERVGAIAIGNGADAASHGIAIGEGARAGRRAVALGSHVTAPDGRLVILEWDLTDVGARLDELEKTVAAQQKIIEKQEEMILALWYYPGMPGAVEAESSFVIHRSRLTE